MLVLEILLKCKKSLTLLATSLFFSLFHLRIFAYRLSWFCLPSFFYEFTKHYMHSHRLLCIFFYNSLFSSRGCLCPECQVGVHTQFYLQAKSKRELS